MLKIDGLTYKFGKKAAVDCLSFEFTNGVYGLLGPNGSGKSTLMNIITDNLKADSGEITYTSDEGITENVLKMGVRFREKLGFMPQYPGLYPNFTVERFMWYMAALKGLPKEKAKKDIPEILAAVELDDVPKRKIGALSGGMKQRLTLAQAVLGDPEILILDEPTSQLDPIAASDFLATLGKINRELGTTIILTEHRLEEAFSFASRVAVMDGGRLLCTGTPAEVGAELKSSGNAMFLAMPAAMRIWVATDSKAGCPISVCDGRNWLLEYANPLIKVTIVPRGRALGAAWYLPEERQITTKEQMLDEMCATLGGRAAEDLFLNRISTGAMNDLERVTKQAYGMIAYLGMSDKLPNLCYYNNEEYSFNRPYSEKTAELIDTEVKNMVNEQYERAKKILSEHREGHNQLAQLLIDKEVIFAEDVERIFGKRPWASRSEEIMAAKESQEAAEAEKRLAEEVKEKEKEIKEEEAENSTEEKETTEAKITVEGKVSIEKKVISAEGGKKTT